MSQNNQNQNQNNRTINNQLQPQSFNQLQDSINPAFLMDRVRSLQEQLNYLATAISEDGSIQQTHLGLQNQNQELKSLLAAHHSFQQKIAQLQTSNSLLKDSLLKQNEEMQDLYNQLQQARQSNSRLIQRTNVQQLQQKIFELNDEISNLLMKIQTLMQELNDQQNQHQDTKYQLQQLSAKLQESNKLRQQLQLSNQYLKEEITKVEELSMKNQKELQDKYIKNINSLSQQIELYRKNTDDKGKDHSNNIKKNKNNSNSDQFNLSSQIITLRSQIANKNEEISEMRQIEMASKKKWQLLLQSRQEQINILNDQLLKIKNKLRNAQRNCSDYVFQLQQQDKDKDRLNFYKNNQKDNEQLKNHISRVQFQKDQLLIKIQHLQHELNTQNLHYQRESLRNDIQKPQEIINNQQLSQQQLQLTKQLVKSLKSTISKYEQDYKQLRLDYEKLYEQKSMIQKIVINNQSQLHKNKSTYQQLIMKYDRTSALYVQLQQQLRLYEKDKSHMYSSRRLTYDKQDYNLIKLENSTLRQELNGLKKEIEKTNKSFINNKVNYSSQYHDHSYDLARNHQIQAYQSRQKQLTRQLDVYHRKYLAQIQKGRRQQDYTGRIEQLQQKLDRVNKMLNDKMNQLDQSHLRQEQLKKQLELSYIKHRQQFDTFGIKHHPQIKKLQSELLASQKTLLEMQFRFKQQNNSLQDETKSLRLQNMHHLAKIDQLIVQLTRQRNNVDYNKMSRSLELSQLKIQQLQQQIQYKENSIAGLRAQIQQNQHKYYNNSNNSESYTKNHKSYQDNAQIMYSLKNLENFINRIDNHSMGKDPCQRAISLLEHYGKFNLKALKNYSPTQISMSNIGTSTITQDNEKDTASRYESLLKQRNQIRQQFEGWQHHNSTYQSKRQKSQYQKLQSYGHQINLQRKNILRKYLQEISS